MDDPSPHLTWRCHPARDEPVRFWLAVAVLLAVGIVSLILLQSALGAVVLLLVVWGSLFEFFVPSDYRVGPDGVGVRRPGRRVFRSWKQLASLHPARQGLLLSPLAEGRGTGWLAQRRGVFLRYAGNAEQVRAAVQRHWASERAL